MELNERSQALLERLADGEFHAVEQLSQDFTLSNSDIALAIAQLTKAGVPVESVSNQGYRIPHGIQRLRKAAIENQLKTSIKEKLDDIIILAQTTSTNDYLLDLAKKEHTKNIACFAEYQSAARGRHGRPWLAPYGTNVYFSLLWHFKKTPTEIVSISLAVALAVVMTLEHHGIQKGLSVKWPNDVYWAGRKIAGVLLEMTSNPKEGCSVVIGIGLNTHIPPELGQTINQPWTDIHTITKQNPDRNRLAGLLLNHLIETIGVFNEQSLTPFLPMWRELDHLIGKTVKLESQGHEIMGVMQDISEKGELILLCDNNQEKRFYSGELSLRMVK